jgi:4-hydroxythreonine-4-phosphate dehydrogenase
MPVKKPRIALVLGDPSGIGPELVARLLADPSTKEKADVLVIADPNELTQGMIIAGQSAAVKHIASLSVASSHQGIALLPYQTHRQHGFERGVSNAASGAYALATLQIALEAVTKGLADALVFAPLNKHALHLAGMQTADEMHWFAQQLGFTGPVSEFNVLDGLWTSRVTSHIAHKEVASQLTQAGVERAIELLYQAMLHSGIAKPRIAVCGLNPHNGDNGSFGREEIDTIAPAVAQALAKGIPVQGPFAADTLFLKVLGDQREFDGIVTMYHDQGQIAMKLMGFWRGVTVQGGLPIPILTPAHGTAFDIAGQGKANPGAMEQAFQMACRMANSQRQPHISNQENAP